MTGIQHAVEEQLVAEKIHFELACVFNQRMVASAFVSPLGIGFLAWLQLESVGLQRALVWSALIVSVEFLIIGIGRAFRQSTPNSGAFRAWLNAQIFCCGLVGVLWGAGTWVIWSPENFLHYVTTLCVLVGVSFSAIVVMTPMRWGVVSFLLGLALGPLAQLTTITSPIGHETAVGWIIMIAIQLWYAMQLRKELVGQIESSVRNTLLVERLKVMGQELTRTNSDLHSAMQQLNQLVTFDQLTGAHSRRFVMDELDRQAALNARHGLPLSLIMLDLDHFKHINDQYGHSVGDRALSVAVSSAKAQLREGDILGRVGGEEFLVLLPMTGREAAFNLAERLRTALAAAALVEGEHTIQLSASLGVAELQGNEEPGAWLRRADQALYQAKATGRNRVIAAD